MELKQHTTDPFPILLPYQQLPEKFDNTFSLWVLPDASCILTGVVEQEPVLKYCKETNKWMAARASEFSEEQTVCFYDLTKFEENNLDLALNRVLDLAGKPSMTDWSYHKDDCGEWVWLESETGWWHHDKDGETGMYLCEAEGSEFSDTDIVKVRQWLRARY